LEPVQALHSQSRKIERKKPDTRRLLKAGQNHGFGLFLPIRGDTLAFARIRRPSDKPERIARFPRVFPMLADASK
jgi:hypothetical protein